MTQLAASLRGELARGQAAGDFDPALSPQDGAFLLIWLVQGLAIRWTLGQRGFPPVEEGQRLLDAQMRLFRSRKTDSSSRNGAPF